MKSNLTSWRRSWEPFGSRWDSELRRVTSEPEQKPVACVIVRHDPSCFGPIKSAAPPLLISKAGVCCRSGRASQTRGCASEGQVNRASDAVMIHHHHHHGPDSGKYSALYLSPVSMSPFHKLVGRWNSALVQHSRGFIQVSSVPTGVWPAPTVPN